MALFGGAQALLKYRGGSFKVDAGSARSEARHWADYYQSPVSIYRESRTGRWVRKATVKPSKKRSNRIRSPHSGRKLRRRKRKFAAKVRKFTISNPRGWIRAKAVKVVRDKRGRPSKLQILTR